MPASPIVDRRLVIVTGKGGVGKTTTCAALARGAAWVGQRVLTVEVGRDAELPDLVGDVAECLLLDPHEALVEYLELQVGFGSLVRRVLAHRGFRQLLEGAPGWRELISIGKVWQLVERSDPDTGPTLVIVDAPATGHGLTFLDVPRVAARAVRSGPLHRHASWVEALLRDPARTLLLPVAIPEELAAHECAELVTRIRGELELPMDRIVLNAAEVNPVADGVALLAAIEAAAIAPDFPWRNALGEWEARFEQTRQWGAYLEREASLPLVPLPFTPGALRSALDDMGASLISDPPRIASR